MKYDAVIIGAGVVGCAIARELSRYDIKIAVIDKNSDVCEGSSKANSGIIHAGHDAKPGTLKAKLNLEGSRMIKKLSEDLQISYRNNGAMVVCLDEGDTERLKDLYDRGVKNGVEGLKILDRDEAFKMEPNLREETTAALYAPTSGIICPFEMTLALAENANANGAEFILNSRVRSIEKTKDGFLVSCENSGNGVEIETKAVVNAAGVFADEIHNMVCRPSFKILPRRGEYCLLDNTVGDHVSHTVFNLPTKLGKGILVTPTVHGNLLVGPTADDTEDKEGTCTTAEGMAKVKAKESPAVRDVPMREVITAFAGLRAHSDRDDFIIEESCDVKNFFDVAGIESPGLSSAPAIGVMVAKMLKEALNAKEKDKFNDKRKGIIHFAALSPREKASLIKEDPSYANIICRCCEVSEAEIVDAVTRALGAVTLDGIKRRTGSQMGRCQGGFCTPKIMEIMNRELKMPYEEITKHGRGSEEILGINPVLLAVIALENSAEHLLRRLAA